MAPLSFDNPAVAPRIQEWTSESYDEATRREVQALIDAGNAKELEDRFYRTLEFGTGGLRGKMGAGTNRMNRYIVARATQGLANYVKEHAEKAGPLRAAVAHDSRHLSREFAEVVAGVFAANGFYVHISPALRPTPWLSFCVQTFGCHTGVMLTASHNPKEYNGYKAYWDDGSQVVPPHDIGIIAEVDKVVDDSLVKIMDFSEGVAKGLIKITGDETDALYLRAVALQRFDEERIRRHAPKIVYTPLHGVGGTMVPKALADWGFSNVICEPDQMIPNGDFPTAESPNPEEPPALKRVLELAKRENGELVLATDPDSDRLGVAVLHDGEYVTLSGNQVCALLADYVIRENVRMGRVTGKPGIVTTVVTSPLVQKVAFGHGAECPLVLTGFKWIAAQLREWLANNGPQFLYGTEESIGYLIGNHCRDKDGVVAACCVAEMAAEQRAEGKTLVDYLHELYLRHGVHHEWQKSITLPGIEGGKKIQAILEAVRTQPPTEIGGVKVVRSMRLDTGDIFEGGKLVGKSPLPKSDVFLFDLADGSRGIVRPSGTEPKIKFYFFLCDQKKKGTLEEVETSLKALRANVATFEKQFFAAIGYQP
ncbi:phospho-sugar mutase [bacterium]|nr:phospho-sugar mutase [bacterium]